MKQIDHNACIKITGHFYMQNLQFYCVFVFPTMPGLSDVEVATDGIKVIAH